MTNPDPYIQMTDEDQAAAVRRQFISTLLGKIDEASQAVTSRAGREAIHAIDHMVRGMLDHIDAQDKTLNQAGFLVEAQSAAITELTTQRDATLDELAQFIKAIKSGNVWGNELLEEFRGKVYEDVMEEHNSNFWESLPYDMASVLGKKWSHMEANTLYNLITLDLNDEEVALNLEGDFGWTREQVITARRYLLKIVRSLRDTGNAATGG